MRLPGQDKATSAEMAAIRERRDEVRTPPSNEPTYVWISLDQRVLGRLVDEAEGGIRLFVESDQGFQVGFEVRVQWEAARRTAHVAHIRQGEGGYFIGLMWA